MRMQILSYMTNFIARKQRIWS